MENWLLLIERNHVSCRVGVFPLRTVPFAILIYHPKVLLTGPEDWKSGRYGVTTQKPTVSPFPSLLGRPPAPHFPPCFLFLGTVKVCVCVSLILITNI